MKILGQKMKTNEIVVIYSAIRYSLGRLSYAPSCVMDYVLNKKSELTEENIKIITRDVTEFFEEFPDACYKKEWDEFLDKLKTSKKEELRMMLLDYSSGGVTTISDIAEYLGRDYDAISDIISVWDREYRALPCDEEGATARQEQAMTASENAIIKELN